MYWLVGLITVSVLGMIGFGVYLQLRPVPRSRYWLRGVLGANVLVFVGGLGGILFLGVQEVFAVTGAAAGTVDVSTGLGLALIGIGVPTGLAAIGAGIAVGPVGAASLAIIAEKPEMFGRTLIYLGLAEGIAIYGLVVTILLLGKIG
ncbi:MAG: ATPase [Gammaproteobacteria bacterium]|nr:ATPase [Gammaproteobacteria bacterium]